MSLEIKQIKTSNIHLPLNDSEQLQRTDEWFELRRGSWTGSKVKAMMTCNRKGASLSWDMPEKIKMFSSGIIPFIYDVAMQRKSGKYLSSKPTSEMRYGTKVEPLIFACAKELYPDLIEVGYKAFDDFPTAGASSDALIPGIATVEMKACVSWGSHYKRTFERTDEKSIDFWQTMCQMKAHNLDKCYYIVAEPPKDMFKYLNYDGDIMDLLDDFKKECPISVETVDASPFHINALFERIKICENAVNAWLADGGRIDDVFWDVVDGISGSADVVESVESSVVKEFDPGDLPF